MNKKYFSKLNFNKKWDENDWEKYFQAQDAYRQTRRNSEIRAKPLSRIKFSGTDEVKAFEPVIREYSLQNIPSIVHELRGEAFAGDQNPDDEVQPTTEEDPHYWREGAPLASLLIYRDCCRFAIFTAAELERYLKRRDKTYKKKVNAEFEALRFHANWIAINVADGHMIGYSDDRIYGNMGKCRRAIRHADTCLGLIHRISVRTQSRLLRYELFAFGYQVRNALVIWLDELKAHVD